MNHRMFFLALEIGVRPQGVPPVGARHVAPPNHVVIERLHVGWRREDDGAGHQLVRRHAGKIARVGLALGSGEIAGGPGKFFKLLVGEFRLVHPKAVENHFVQGLFVRLALLGTHHEFARGNPHHVIRPVGIIWPAVQNGGCGGGNVIHRPRRFLGLPLVGVGLAQHHEGTKADRGQHDKEGDGQGAR